LVTYFDPPLHLFNPCYIQQLLEEFAERNKKLLAKGGKRMKIVESSSDEEEEERSKVSSPGKQTKLSSETRKSNFSCMNLYFSSQPFIW